MPITTPKHQPMLTLVRPAARLAHTRDITELSEAEREEYLASRKLKRKQDLSSLQQPIVAKAVTTPVTLVDLDPSMMDSSSDITNKRLRSILADAESSNKNEGPEVVCLDEDEDEDEDDDDDDEDEDDFDDSMNAMDDENETRSQGETTPHASSSHLIISTSSLFKSPPQKKRNDLLSKKTWSSELDDSGYCTPSQKQPYQSKPARRRDESSDMDQTNNDDDDDILVSGSGCGYSSVDDSDDDDDDDDLMDCGGRGARKSSSSMSSLSLSGSGRGGRNRRSREMIAPNIHSLRERERRSRLKKLLLRLQLTFLNVDCSYDLNDCDLSETALRANKILRVRSSKQSILHEVKLNFAHN